MRIVIITAALSLIMGLGPLFAFVDVFSEVAPSDKPEGYHTKVKLRKQGGDNWILTLPRVGGIPEAQAWLVVCKEARGDGHRNFRYDVHWLESTANKPDIQLVVPIKFDGKGSANLQLTDDLLSRSYVVFGGYYDDGAFSTVNLPAFRKALNGAAAE